MNHDPLMLMPDDRADARIQLEAWRDSRRELGFVYLRQGGGLIQSGRARLVVIDDGRLTLSAGTCSLLVVHLAARLVQGPQWFFENDLSGAYQVDGVGLALANQDWLFLSETDLPANLAQMALARLG